MFFFSFVFFVFLHWPVFSISGFWLYALRDKFIEIGLRKWEEKKRRALLPPVSWSSSGLGFCADACRFFFCFFLGVKNHLLRQSSTMVHSICIYVILFVFLFFFFSLSFFSNLCYCLLITKTCPFFFFFGDGHNWMEYTLEWEILNSLDYC